MHGEGDIAASAVAVVVSNELEHVRGEVGTRVCNGNGVSGGLHQ
jgi:hypothetical protein